MKGSTAARPFGRFVAAPRRAAMVGAVDRLREEGRVRRRTKIILIAVGVFVAINVIAGIFAPPPEPEPPTSEANAPPTMAEEWRDHFNFQRGDPVALDLTPIPDDQLVNAGYTSGMNRSTVTHEIEFSDGSKLITEWTRPERADGSLGAVVFSRVVQAGR